MAFIRIHERPTGLIDIVEHQSATPSTFSSQVLHFFSKNAQFKTVPMIDLSGQVDIYITSENMIIFSENLSLGLQIPYPKIILHAIHQTPHNAFDTTCIYIQIEDLEGFMSTKNDVNGDPSELYSNMVELYILPSDPLTLNDFFAALSNCSSLHPCTDQNSDEKIDESSSEHEWITQANGNPETPASAGQTRTREEEEINETKWRCTD
ncbi:unnamed protein product [Pneumocystis jirovecii]|uniref:Uncharacterized protein n=2 Tax=Pneumocystis jirovecii TaxID=42068 RepID=L0PIS5_PNEJI|nr:uncharacterized protein T551_00433 [Pneumocystis jirovecii RU7]KTW32343.1 hypothetical protein T551_00433 [Pneumocystis jirovecii RU7]CCJ29952.1 unnamed protein product [Pneumocystis jirovecii]CCJ31540.1 unnamed protein product [Pneumocystis jirovecii]